MTFAEEFVEQLQNAGVPVPAESVPEREVLDRGLQSIQNWIGSLDENTQAALDEVTADFPVKAGLANDNVGIAPDLGGFLAAIDQLQASFPISTIVSSAVTASAAAAAAAAPPTDVPEDGGNIA